MHQTTIASRRIVRHQRPSFYPGRNSLHSFPYTYLSHLIKDWAPLGSLSERGCLRILLQNYADFNDINTPTPERDTILHMDLYLWLTRFRSLDDVTIDYEGSAKTLGEFNKAPPNWDKRSPAIEEYLHPIDFRDLLMQRFHSAEPRGCKTVDEHWRMIIGKGIWESARDKSFVFDLLNYLETQEEGPLRETVDEGEGKGEGDTLPEEQTDCEDQEDGWVMEETEDESEEESLQVRSGKRKKAGKKKQRARVEKKLREYKEQRGRARRRPPLPSMEADSKSGSEATDLELQSEVNSNTEAERERRVSWGSDETLVEEEDSKMEEPEPQRNTKPTAPGQPIVEDDGSGWDKVLSKKEKKKANQPKAQAPHSPMIQKSEKKTTPPTFLSRKRRHSFDQTLRLLDEYEIREAKVPTPFPSDIQESNESAPRTPSPRTWRRFPDGNPRSDERDVHRIFDAEAPAPSPESPRSDAGPLIFVRLPGSAVRSPHPLTPGPITSLPHYPASMQQSFRVIGTISPQTPSPKTRGHFWEGSSESDMTTSPSPETRQRPLGVKPGRSDRNGSPISQEDPEKNGLAEIIRESSDEDNEPTLYSKMSRSEYKELLRQHKESLEKMSREIRENHDAEHPPEFYEAANHSLGGTRRASDPGAPRRPHFWREIQSPTPAFQSPLKATLSDLSSGPSEKKEEVESEDKGKQDSSGPVQSVQSSTQRSPISQKQQNPQAVSLNGQTAHAVQSGNVVQSGNAVQSVNAAQSVNAVQHHGNSAVKLQQSTDPGARSMPSMNGSAPVFQPQMQPPRPHMPPPSQHMHPRPGILLPGQTQPGHLQPGNQHPYLMSPMVPGAPTFVLLPYHEPIPLAPPPRPPTPGRYRAPFHNSSLQPNMLIDLPRGAVHQERFPPPQNFQKPPPH
ncbi:hypothetical protein HDK64DRAFT_316027 [Phyllosticta capitalensis]